MTCASRDNVKAITPSPPARTSNVEQWLALNKAAQKRSNYIRKRCEYLHANAQEVVVFG